MRAIDITVRVLGPQKAVRCSFFKIVLHDCHLLPFIILFGDVVQELCDCSVGSGEGL